MSDEEQHGTRQQWGRALLTGTIECTHNEAFRLALELHQDQKVNRQLIDVHSESEIPVNCTTSPAWSASMGLAPFMRLPSPVSLTVPSP